MDILPFNPNPQFPPNSHSPDCNENPLTAICLFAAAESKSDLSPDSDRDPCAPTAAANCGRGLKWKAGIAPKNQ